MFCGVDEAGKGAVLGPMVVAAVGCDHEDILPDSGLKDSKQLSPEKRSRLYEEIAITCSIAVRVVSAVEIDSGRKSMTMNVLLARLHAAVITDLVPHLAYVDACDVIAERYGHMVTNFLGCECRVVAEHHADESFPLVSAASIVAKVVRDREIEELSKKYGEIGSGYPSDPKTVDFLSAAIQCSGKPPVFARRSWKTVGKMMAEQSQASILDFS
ncbi:MAG: ribonuclease HII [Methanoregulaceae archaeon]|jgi:ribonuclease HII|nr:ribonuclease HII [Methanoregulaceae archaeon]